MINYRNQLGLSFIEILLSSVIFSIIVIGLMNFHTVLMTRLTQFETKNQAEIIAFSLLDSYPDVSTIDLPHNWQYQVRAVQYGDSCKIVSVIIQPYLGDEITQKRWFCRKK